jgi:hypothetical protein
MNKFKWMYEFSRHVSQEDFIDTMIALDCPSHVVDVYLSNDTGEPKFVVEIPGTGIWLNAFGSENEAVEFCKSMEWKYNVCPLQLGI